MLSNTWDANRICRLLGYTKHILVIRMVREIHLCSLKVGGCEAASSIPRYTMYYKEVIKLELFIFLESLKVLGKSKSFGKFKSFIKKKNKGFFITLRICLVILGMLTASADF